MECLEKNLDVFSKMLVYPSCVFYKDFMLNRERRNNFSLTKIIVPILTRLLLQTNFRAPCLKISHQLLFQTDLLEQNNGEATVINYYQEVLEMKHDCIFKRDQYGSRRNGCDIVNGNDIYYNGG